MEMNDIKENTNTLEYLEEQVKTMPKIYQPSEFWTDLNSVHHGQINTATIENFKRSINVRYFNWRALGIIRHQMTPILRQVFKGNFKPIFKSKFLNPKQAGAKKVTNFNW